MCKLCQKKSNHEASADIQKSNRYDTVVESCIYTLNRLKSGSGPRRKSGTTRASLSLPKSQVAVHPHGVLSLGHYLVISASPPRLTACKLVASKTWFEDLSRGLRRGSVGSLSKGYWAVKKAF